MSNIILLFLCMLIGIALRRYGRVPDNAHLAINGFIINVSLPALTLLQIHGIKLQSTLAYAVAMPWLLFTIAVLFFWGLSRFLHFTPATTGGLILVAGLGNTSFVGLPMIESFYGSSGMPIGILIDQLGTYLVLSRYRGRSTVLVRDPVRRRNSQAHLHLSAVHRFSCRCCCGRSIIRIG
jgi:malate permease and related proteins